MLSPSPKRPKYAQYFLSNFSFSIFLFSMPFHSCLAKQGVFFSFFNFHLPPTEQSVQQPALDPQDGQEEKKLEPPLEGGWGDRGVVATDRIQHTSKPSPTTCGSDLKCELVMCFVCLKSCIWYSIKWFGCSNRQSVDKNGE